MNESPPQSHPASSDYTLMRRFRSGEDDAATALYLRYSQRIRRLAESQLGSDLSGRVDAEDVVQSVFRTFFRRSLKGGYDIPEGEELWKLFLVISLNKIRSTASFHRSTKRSVQNTSGLGERDVATNAHQEQQSYDTLRMVVDDLLADLPETQREIVVMRINGFEVNDISEKLKRAKRTVERVLQNFRQRLASIIKQEIPGLSGEL
jgi:RNA polymerase sigma-70 factor (ECF subfamily)